MAPVSRRDILSAVDLFGRFSELNRWPSVHDKTLSDENKPFEGPTCRRDRVSDECWRADGRTDRRGPRNWTRPVDSDHPTRSVRRRSSGTLRREGCTGATSYGAERRRRDRCVGLEAGDVRRDFSATRSREHRCRCPRNQSETRQYMFSRIHLEKGDARRRTQFDALRYKSHVGHGAITQEIS